MHLTVRPFGTDRDVAGGTALKIMIRLELARFASDKGHSVKVGDGEMGVREARGGEVERSVRRGGPAVARG